MTRTQRFLRGLRAALPIAVGYVPIAFSFGLVCRDAGVSLVVASLMSLLVYAGASQFAAIAMLRAGSPVPEIVLATFFLNLRHLVMGLSLLPKLRIHPKATLAAIAAGLTDETFAVASFTRDPAVTTREGMIGLCLLSWISWWGGTVVGRSLATLMPSSFGGPMGVMLYGLFIGLLIPALRAAKSPRQGLVVAGSAMVAHMLARHVLPSGWAIVAAIVAGSLLGPLVGRPDD